MEEVYCPKCGRGYTEKIYRNKTVELIVGKEYRMKYKVDVYRCNDCGYEFIRSSL